MKKGEASRFPFPLKPGAGDESRTRDLNLGKVALYQLSYSRGEENANSTESESLVKHPAQILVHLGFLGKQLKT